MMTPRTSSEVNGILQSFTQIFKQKRMDKLTENAYRYIMNAFGFIAHYNRLGFIENYPNVYEFAEEIIRYTGHNCCNYNSTESDYPYYKQKADMYISIIDIIRKYIPD